MRSASESAAARLRGGNLVVVTSTVPPGTTERLVAPILEARGLRAGRDFHLAFCPERVMPGNVMHEVVHNARIVGGVTPESSAAAASLFSSFVRGEILVTDACTAEIVKLAENSFRDVNIAFANQMASIAEVHDVDAAEVIRLANYHPRVNILRPGIGVGGHCIPVDPWFLIEAAPDRTGLLRAARKINDEMPARVADRIADAVKDLDAPRIVCLGATYKPDVHDVRGSPAIDVHRNLLRRGLDASLFDPLVSEYYVESVLTAAGGADLLVVLVAHTAIAEEFAARRADILAAMRHARFISFSPAVQ